jgi:mannosylfructose-phosphate synthase
MNRPHTLMITNHGIHEWNVTPGLPDTGGQNVYVNQLTEALIETGHRVTIANRGGFPHPRHGRLMTGDAPHPSGHARIVYLEDGLPEFVRKEDMAERLAPLAESLLARLDGDPADLIISHYWDGGVLGIAAQENLSSPHLWAPHSLGALKAANVNPATWGPLRITERIAQEQKLVDTVDGVVSTSMAIRNTLRSEYGHDPRFTLPPGVDETRYRPRGDDECSSTWVFLAHHSPHTAEELRQRRVITEISRTDLTKRKDVLLRAFAEVLRSIPEAVLVVAIDELAQPVASELHGLIDQLGIGEDVITLGSVWEQLPCLYAISEVYCTPSVMEGFGMSAQEAAATGVPVVASELVPFAVEYLLGSDPTPLRELLVGEGAVVVPADSVGGFAEALQMLLTDEAKRRAMGEAARRITVPHFSWNGRTRALLDQLDLRG